MSRYLAMTRKKAIERLGKKFNHLTIQKIFKKGNKWFCKSKCDCGLDANQRLDSVVSGQVKSCGCLQYNSCYRLKGADSPHWRGYGELPGFLFARIEDGASRRNLKFEVTKSYLWTLFVKQNEKCALTGLPIKLGAARQKNTTASLDRIDNSKGYVESNVQWVHKDINKLKTDFDQSRFIDLCKAIATHEA